MGVIIRESSRVKGLTSKLSLKENYKSKTLCCLDGDKILPEHPNGIPVSDALKPKP